MSAARTSHVPGLRRGPSLFSSSLSASQSAGGPSQAAFSFRPHVIFTQNNGGGGGSSSKDQGNAALLDYSDLTERIEVFKELFLAQSEQMMQELQRSEAEHKGSLREEKRNIELTKEAIDRQKDEQKKLYQVVASERQADSSAQSQLALLHDSQVSLQQRLLEAEEERKRLQTLIDKKLQEKSIRKARLVSEVKRNKPELRRFNEKLGCRISSGHQEGSESTPLIKFTFNLINPEDWSYEAKFVLDVSKSKYRILTHSPDIPQEKLDDMLAELNTSRGLYAFIKRMRAAFKEQLEQQRKAQRATRNAA